MTAAGSHPHAVRFEAPALSTVAAWRDRHLEVQERAAMVRDAAYTEGYQAGWLSGEAELERAVADQRHQAERLARAAAALEVARRELAGRDRAAVAELEIDLVTFASGLAAELIGRELSVAEEPVLDALRRAAQLAPDRGVPVIRVHPDDAATVSQASTGGIFAWTDEIRVVADATVEPGACVVEVGACRIDTQIGPALARVRDALG